MRAVRCAPCMLPRGRRAHLLFLMLRQLALLLERVLDLALARLGLRQLVCGRQEGRPGRRRCSGGGSARRRQRQRTFVVYVLLAHRLGRDELLVGLHW